MQFHSFDHCVMINNYLLLLFFLSFFIGIFMFREIIFSKYMNAIKLMCHDLKNKTHESKNRKTRRSVRLFLIRHAESTMNLNPHIICGRSNLSELSEHGIEQAHSLGIRLKKIDLKFENIYSSTAKRAKDTAKIVSEHLESQQQICEVPDILEISLGGSEGRKRCEIYTDMEKIIIARDPWTHRSIGIGADGCEGESLKQVEMRVKKFIENKILLKVNDHMIHDDIIPNVALFMHGISINCFLRSIQGSSVSGVTKNKINNTSITEILYDVSNDSPSNGWKIIRVNDHSHLE